MFPSEISSRRLAAIMFTDMVGYTVLGQRNESLALALLEEHRKLVRPLVARHNGREVKTIGDAFMVEFSSSLDAVTCAYDIQRVVREFNFSLSPDKRFQLRIGVHLGDVVYSENGDISGDAVNVASRVESLAEEGGVCITRQVFDSVRGKLGLEMQSLGAKAMKNVVEPIEVFKMVMPWSVTDLAFGEGQLQKDLDKKRIAILPFRNMSLDPNDEYFAEGMTEELIATLAKIRQLTVIARTSIMQYRNTTKRVSQIARELDVGSMIEGSVRKSGERIRITIQLIDSKTEGHLWVENYDKSLGDLFVIQSEIAQKVADELKVKLAGDERELLRASPTTESAAYTLYLKGRYFWNERGKEGIQKAIVYFLEAVKKDNNFALGYSGLADCYQAMARNGLAEYQPTYEKAKEYAIRALDLDPNLAEAHATRGSTLHYYEHDWDRSEEEFRRAIELKPSYSSAHQWYSHVLAQERRLQEAGAEIRRAHDLDPYSLAINHNLGAWYYFCERYDEAIAQFKKLNEMDTTNFSGFIGPGPSLIRALVQKGEYDEAFRQAEGLTRIIERPKLVNLWKAYVYAAVGKKAEARKLLQEVESDYQRENVSPYEIGLVHFMLGENDAGFSWLKTAYSVYDGNIAMLTLDVELQPVRDDPRYLSILVKVGLGNVRFSKW